MNWPKQSRDIPLDQQAMAPFNFIELPDRIATVSEKNLPDHDRYYPDRLTGRIECELTTASPLYIRAGWIADTRNASSKDLTPSEFNYSCDPSQPVIPGSALRGMLRSILEIVSFSKMQLVTHQKFAYRAVNDTDSRGENYRKRLMNEKGGKYEFLVNAGYIVKRGADWFIQPASTHDGATWGKIRDTRNNSFLNELQQWKNCKNAFEIYVSLGMNDYQNLRRGFIQIRFIKAGSASKTPQAGLQPAVLVKGGPIRNKTSEIIVLPPKPDAPLLPIDHSIIESYRSQITPGQISLLGRDGVLKDGQPVFYLSKTSIGPVEFFGHTPFFRIPYPYSPADFIPESLRNPSGIDMAEALFGFIQPALKAKTAYLGRVRLTDGILEADPTDIWLRPGRPLTPKILATPKPSAFAHYLVQSAPKNQLPSKVSNQPPLSRQDMVFLDYTATPSTETVIRGHKLYWHKGDIAWNDVEDSYQVDPSDSMRTQIKPIKSGIKFHFNIHFVNLTSEELGALLFVLDIASKPEYRLSLGAGKPLGMGAVSIKSRLCISNLQNRYSRLFINTAWNESFEAETSIYESAISEFEEWVAKQIGWNHSRVIDHPRIQQLLAMLTWPGPDPERTQYMEISYLDPITKRKVNKFKISGPLPNPMDVLHKSREPRSDGKLDKGRHSTWFTGIVKTFGQGSNKSFGFITRDDNGQDIFVHRSGFLENSIESGQRVRFRIGEMPLGKQALDVSLIAPSHQKFEVKSPPSGYQIGIVKTYGLGPGNSFGYIQPEDGSDDILVYRRGLAQGVNTIFTGQKVIYRISTTGTTRTAIDVKPYDTGEKL